MEDERTQSHSQSSLHYSNATRYDKKNSAEGTGL